ncbi:hypothetical protein [Embleya sp. NPDC005971]|uniref:hypothetical protein n=1 Tax=Embleya sp. NPDC005971 TaxID=3156724 RepID=UPI0033EF974B
MRHGGDESTPDPAARAGSNGPDAGADRSDRNERSVRRRARRARADLVDLCRRRLEQGAVRRTEALVVGRYPELVRLAYLILPPAMERHRRVLAAHALVQDALPGRLRDRGRRPGVVEMSEADLVRLHVVRGALRPNRSGRHRVLLPQVWGLRLFPPTGDADEPAIEQALGRLSGPARAFLVLRVLDGLDPVEAGEFLLAAGVEDVLAAETEADAGGPALRPAGHPDGPGLTPDVLRADPFDPCTLRATPSDLLRRRRRRHLALGVLASATAIATIAWYTMSGSEPSTGDGGRADRATSAARVVGGPPRSIPAGAWVGTTRLDFDVWSTRGARAGDEALTRRAMRAWADPDDGTAVTLGRGTAVGPPTGVPRVLYAGDVAGATVVLLADGTRLARYTDDHGRRTLDVAAADDSDERSASAVVLRRDPAGVRMLLAPWVDEAAVRDLRRPEDKSRPLAITGGVTAPMPDPGTAGKGCVTVPVLELLARRAADNHPYLLADLGELSATHLTYMPPPEYAHTGRPSEAASSERALGVWSRTACALETLRGRGLRLVNNWEFAHFDLPEAAGEAMWSCLHAFDRRGGGDVVVQFLPPGASATGAQTVNRLVDSPACSRSGNDIVTSTWWRSRTGAWYLVAAGTRDVVRVVVSGVVSGVGEGRQVVVKGAGGGLSVGSVGSVGSAGPAGPAGPAVPTVVGNLRNGGTVRGLG